VPESFDLTLWLIRIPPLLFALTVHEFAHALMAYRCGDDTARLNGRLTLDPLAHLDPIGTICMLFSFYGWAKPVPVNPFNFRHPRRDDILVSIAGVAANLATAVAVALVLRLTQTWGAWETHFGGIGWNMLILLCQFSVGLMLFNLIPIPPLDGSHVLSQLLPYQAARAYDRFAPMGQFVLIGLIVSGAVGVLWRWPMVWIVHFLLGNAWILRHF
jgi:Zn-dependent protease